MRDILFVINDLQTGGTERQAALLAGELTKAGIPVTLYSFAEGPSRRLFEQGGVEVMTARGGALSIPFAAMHLFWLMLTRRPRLVHFFLPGAYLVGAPLAALARIPARVMSRRSLNAYQRNGFIRAVERLLHRTMHAVLGNSRGVVAQLREEGVAPGCLGLIYNGIDPAQFAGGERHAARARLGLSPQALVMCIVANLIPYKGHRDLIAALALAAPSLPPGWRLLVAGRDDGIGAQLKEQAQRLGLQDNIVFLGLRTDVGDILGASDIGLLCSHEEGFSNAILEGMSAGLPMIVTHVGGNAEAVADGETGTVVPPHDPAQLAAAIVRLAADPALRARMGGAGRTRVAARFGVPQFVLGHRKLYDALLAGKTPADVPEIKA